MRCGQCASVVRFLTRRRLAANRRTQSTDAQIRYGIMVDAIGIANEAAALASLHPISEAGSPAKRRARNKSCLDGLSSKLSLLRAARDGEEALVDSLLRSGNAASAADQPMLRCCCCTVAATRRCTRPRPNGSLCHHCPKCPHGPHSHPSSRDACRRPTSRPATAQAAPRSGGRFAMATPGSPRP